MSRSVGPPGWSRRDHRARAARVREIVDWIAEADKRPAGAHRARAALRPDSRSELDRMMFHNVRWVSRKRARVLHQGGEWNVKQRVVGSHDPQGLVEELPGDASE